MLNEYALEKGKAFSVIRSVFEYAKKRKSEIGDDKVFDFSIGNPSIATPSIVKETLIKLLENEDPIKLHEYTSSSGDINSKKAIAEYLNKTYNAKESDKFIYLTCGAAASLSISLNALLNEKEEVIVFCPFFAEYTVFIEKAGGKVVPIKPDMKTMLPDLEDFEKNINEKTKVIIINSPNNPTGAIYDEGTLKNLQRILEKKEKEYNHPIYVLSDEPYRELVYDEKTTPYTAKFIKNTISCYSFSKSLSLPGERIGYICVTSEVEDKENVYYAIIGAGRSMGFVCAPTIFQKMIPYVIGKTSDISKYDESRKLLYEIVTKAGFKAIYPDGAFYLFVKTPTENAQEFCDRAKKYELMFVRSDEFGLKGFVRLAYCKTKEEIKNSEQAFLKLGEEYKWI